MTILGYTSLYSPLGYTPVLATPVEWQPRLVPAASQYGLVSHAATSVRRGLRGVCVRHSLRRTRVRP